MSPRTDFIHVRQNASALREVFFIVHEFARLCAHLFSASEAHSVHEGLANRFGSCGSIGHQFGERPFGAFICSKVENCHGNSIRQNVRQNHYDSVAPYRLA